jgi:hypothetical protein
MSTSVELLKVDVEMPVFQTMWTERLDEFKQLILEHRKEFPTNCQDCNVNASWRSAWNIQQTDPKRFDPITQYFQDLAESVGNQYFSTNGVFDVINMWAMMYGPKEGTKYHTHFPSALSVIFYIDVEENAAPICIGNSCRPVENGLVLIFDASIPHWVPDDGDGKRIVLAANLDFVPSQIRGTWKAY